MIIAIPELLLSYDINPEDQNNNKKLMNISLLNLNKIPF